MSRVRIRVLKVFQSGRDKRRNTLDTITPTRNPFESISSYIRLDFNGHEMGGKKNVFQLFGFDPLASQSSCLSIILKLLWHQ